MSGLNREKGLEKSDGDALNPEQRSKLRQLKVDVQKLDEKYIRVRWSPPGGLVIGSGQKISQHENIEETSENLRNSAQG